MTRQRHLSLSDVLPLPILSWSASRPNDLCHIRLELPHQPAEAMGYGKEDNSVHCNYDCVDELKARVMLPFPMPKVV